jgi:hypothetical protein
MRNLPLISLSALILGFAPCGASAQTQTAPSGSTVQTPEESVQPDVRNRSGADVTIERDWKAQGGENDRTGSVKTNEGHETIGRDWRAQPKKEDQ